jgi:RNA polymerase sigma-54 factor
MTLRQRLELRQAQHLVMTPQLRQAIQMLQMSAVDLSAFLAQQIESNPLIAFAEDGAAAEGRAHPAPSNPPVDAEIRRADVGAVEAPFDTGRENLFDAGGEAAALGRAGPGGRADFETFDGEGDQQSPVSLAQHVAGQLALARLDPIVRATAEALAADIDEAGYLRTDPGEAAERLGVSPTVIEAAAAAIRACEPTGVGARDLAECLALQLAERDRLDPAMRALLDNLALLPTASPQRMAALCGVDAEDFAEMLSELRALDPRPGLRFGPPAAEPAAPDVLVSPDGGGGWRVELNPETTPRLLIDRSYAARIDGADRSARLYLAECAQTASWLKKSLDQRARTILSVSAEIVRAQSAFLERGVAGLRPMTLRDVAKAVGVHESTVSRVTANKFMFTPRGVFELKYFFTTAIGGAEGSEACSAEAVRARIRALVAAEPPERPLSDDQIMALLKGEGVDVARRTVAKYRESLNIPSSVQRRRRARSAV